MKHFVFALISCLCLTGLSHAEPVNHRMILSVAERVDITFADNYESQTGRELPFYFTVQVPRFETEIKAQFQFENEGNLAFARYNTKDGALAELLTMSWADVTPGTPQERAQNLFGLIEGQVYPSLQAPQDARILGGRNATVAGLPAVEYMALFELPNFGLIYARIVGVFVPQTDRALILIQQTASNQITLGGPDDMAKTFVGEILNSVKFAAYRDPSGALVRY